MVNRPPTTFRPAFMLVDVIVATIILGVCLSVMISLSARAIASQSHGEHLVQAAALADEQLQLLLARGPDDYQHRFPLQGSCDKPFDNYKYTLALSGGGSAGEPFEVVCTISWQESGKERAVDVHTRMASRAGAPDGKAEPDRKPTTTVDRAAS